MKNKIKNSGWQEYQIILDYNNGSYSIDIVVGFYLLVDSREQAMRAAGKYEDELCSALDVYYNQDIKQIVIDVFPNNRGIKNPKIQRCTWYDKSLGPYLTHSDGNITLNYICNPVCMLDVDLSTFLYKIEQDYCDYFKTRNKSRVTFECIAYGVEESHHLLGSSQGL